MSSAARGLVAVRRSLLALVLIAGVVFGWRTGLFRLHDMQQLRAAIAAVRDTPFLPALFVVAYAVFSTVGVPASPLTLAGGALFGATRGAALNWIGAFSGALLSFGVVRMLSPASRLANMARGRVAGRMLTAGAPLMLFRLRLIPVVPFLLLNVGAAFSPMTWRSYALATGLGIVPVTVIYTLFSANLIAGIQGSGTRAIVIALASAAGIIAITVVANRRRRIKARLLRPTL
jgi:uncharacterized membrane protein YdjX (TVP38/TMEM64 family)